MVCRSPRARVVAFALCLALAVGLVLPAMALAGVIGDSPYSNASTMTVPFSDAGSLNYIPAPYEAFEYWYSVPMTAGQTIEVTTTASPEVDLLSIIWSTDTSNQNAMYSDFMGNGVDRLRFMAPYTGNYSLGLSGLAAGTFTVNAVTIAPMTFSLKSTVAPSKVKANKTLSVSAKIVPGYNSITVPVRFFVQRKVNGRWTKYTSKLSSMTDGDETYTKCAASFKFSKKGTYRIRARFQDAAHPTAKYNSYRTVYVK